MSSMSWLPQRTCGALAMVLLLAGVVGAEEATVPDTGRLIQVHGFGTVSYGNTDGINEYADGAPSGDFGGNVSLVLSAQPMKKLSIDTNVALDRTRDGFTPVLEYAFAEWRFSDVFKVRAGRVKQPFGLYTEIFDVGTLRPFVTLPEGLYGPSGFVSEGFDGLSATGRFHTSGRWALGYDVYGGSIALSAEQATPEVFDDGSIVHAAERLRSTVGARFNLETPATGLMVGASAYTGVEDAGRHSAAGVHAEYLSDGWSLRTEFAHRNEDRGIVANAFYLEAARQFGKWQVAARHDRSNTSEETALPPAAEALRHHRDNSVGLNYWFKPGLVVKLSYHRIDGNQFAHPGADEISEAIRHGGLDGRTNMVVLGAQFAF